MSERRDAYAPIRDVRCWQRFQRQAAVARRELFDRYEQAHKGTREQEMVEFGDGFAWRGPMRFTAPIESVQQYAPNTLVLRTVEKVLNSIIEWPNARRLAFQLKQCIRYGAEQELYKPVAQIGRLMAKIAQEKPYGEQTVGINLLYIDWETVYWDRNFGDGVSTRSAFAGLLQSLTAFSRGKYAHCLNDYPDEPFWRLKAIPTFEGFSPADQVAYRGYIIRTHYPILTECPDLARRLVKQ